MNRTKSSPKKAARPTTEAAAKRVRELASTAKKAKSSAEKANKKRAAELIALIARRKSEIVEAFYDIGEALLELSKPSVYGAAGSKSFKELVARHSLMSASQAFKLIRIVKNVSRETALSLGQEKAYALIGLTEATPEKDTVEDLIGASASEGAPLRDASRRSIERLTEDTRKKHHKPTAKERDAARDARDAVEAVRKHFIAAGVRGLKLTVVDKRVRVELTFEQSKKLASSD